MAERGREWSHGWLAGDATVAGMRVGFAGVTRVEHRQCLSREAHHRLHRLVTRQRRGFSPVSPVTGAAGGAAESEEKEEAGQQQAARPETLLRSKSTVITHYRVL